MQGERANSCANRDKRYAQRYHDYVYHAMCASFSGRSSFYRMPGSTPALSVEAGFSHKLLEASWILKVGMLILYKNSCICGAGLVGDPSHT